MDSDAILPSSPPRASAPSLPSSPFFEPRDHTFSPKSSSPPPLFSSDDSRESADVGNYESPRIFKNKRKGAWWESENGESAHNTPEPKKTKMTRNFDSGVFMMSDASDGSQDPLPEHKSPFDLPNTWNEHSFATAVESVFYSRLRMGLDKNAEVYDFKGLDLDDEEIRHIGELDSVIKMPPIPGSSLPTEGQFRSMIPELHLDLSDNYLNRLTPSLFDVRFLTTLDLRNNSITELPSQIGQLRNLQILNLSLNKLVSLPFELLKLFKPYGKLEDIRNVGNQDLLEHKLPSPAYMFNLASPGRIVPRPTPRSIEEHQILAYEMLPDLYANLPTSSDPEGDIWCIRKLESWTSMSQPMSHDEKLQVVDEGFFSHHPQVKYQCIRRAKEEEHIFSPTYYARTPVSYLDQAGMLIRGSPAQPTSNQDGYCTIVETTRGAYDLPTTWFSPPSTSSVQPLVATCIHNVLRKRHLDSLSIADVRDLIPEPVPIDADGIIEQAMENSKGGYSEFRNCHVCKREYITARAEWIEFWQYKRFYPLKVKVCSWSCVPAEMRERPKELVIGEQDL